MRGASALGFVVVRPPTLEFTTMTLPTRCSRSRRGDRRGRRKVFRDAAKEFGNLLIEARDGLLYRQTGLLVDGSSKRSWLGKSRAIVVRNRGR